MGNIRTKVHLEKIFDDTLVLGVTDSCWMQELYLLSPILIETINKTLDQPRIKHLRFKKRALHKHHKPEAKQLPPKVFTAPRLSAQENQVLQQVKDPQLRCALEKFLMRCYREKA